MENKLMWSEIVDNFTKFIVEESRKFINIGFTGQKDGICKQKREQQKVKSLMYTVWGKQGAKYGALEDI
jgi:hypothetical protein